MNGKGGEVGSRELRLAESRYGSWWIKGKTGVRDGLNVNSREPENDGSAFTRWQPRKSMLVGRFRRCEFPWTVPSVEPWGCSARGPHLNRSS